VRLLLLRPPWTWMGTRFDLPLLALRHGFRYALPSHRASLWSSTRGGSACAHAKLKAVVYQAAGASQTNPHFLLVSYCGASIMCALLTCTAGRAFTSL
jgi:hypothetical protein